MWSISNRIPMQPEAVLKIWERVRHLDFDTAFGAFKGQDIRTVNNEGPRETGGVKGRLLQSMKIYVKAMGWNAHSILEEKL